MRRILGKTLIVAALAAASLAHSGDARADSSCKALLSGLHGFSSNSWGYIQVGVSTTQPGVDFQKNPVGLWGSGVLIKGIPSPYRMTPILTSTSSTRQRHSADTFASSWGLQISIYDIYGYTRLTSKLLGSRTLTSTTCSGNVMWGFDDKGKMHVLTFTKLVQPG